MINGIHHTDIDIKIPFHDVDRMEQIVKWENRLKINYLITDN
jgi:hypothetical protein